MNLDMLLLGLLRNRTASGYDLAREIHDEERHLWRASTSQIYATLRRLEQQGLLNSRAARSRKGPARRLYRLRAEGHDHLQNFLDDVTTHEAERVPWLARLRVIDSAETETARRLLGQAHAGLLRESVRLRALLDEGGNDKDPTTPSFYRLATLQCALSTAQLRLKWCEQTLEELAAAQDP